MNVWRRFLLGVSLAAGVMLSVPVSAETVKLGLKRAEGSARVIRSGDDMLYRYTYPQHFFMQIMKDREASDASSKEFQKVVKKEPEEYNSERPFRGVAALGSGKYAFVFDTEEGQSKGYRLLRFDTNLNGDLTDDEIVKAESNSGSMAAQYYYASFPRIDVTIGVEGKQVDYAFFMSVNESYGSDDFRYASASLNAAAYRVGEITLEGKSHRLALLDFNSNGRFDDRIRIRGDVMTSSGQRQVYPEQGDMLLIDAKAENQISPYEVTSNDFRHHVSELVSLDGKFYELKPSPSGDELTLSPADGALGKVTNPNKNFRAVIYGDRGFLKIKGGDEPVALPVGKWKLLSYTIDGTGLPAEPAKEDPATPEGGVKSLLSALVEALTGRSAVSPAGVARYTIVSADATEDCPTIVVREGETAELPFGPPFKPVVRVGSAQPTGEVNLSLSMVGSAGEVCSDLRVDGQRPEAPKFTITDKEGEVVTEGTFRYG